MLALLAQGINLVAKWLIPGGVFVALLLLWGVRYSKHHR